MVEAPEAPHHHHAKTGLPWFDLLVPVAVLAISIASLLTSLQSERSMHALVEQNSRLVSAQSTPLLMLDSGNQEQGKSILSMKLSNVGTGPARIAWFHLVDAKGQSFTAAGLEQYVTKQHIHTQVLSEQISSTLVRSGAERLVFSWAKPTDDPAAMAAWESLDQSRFGLKASACYCSMFDECKTTEFGDSTPKPVPSCEQH